MEALLTHGEGLLVPERMIVAPSVGVFRPLDDVDAGDHVDEGQTVGHLDGPGTSTPVCSPFRGQLVGHARPPRRAPPRGPARRLAASRLSMRAAIAGWGTAAPRAAAHQRRPRAARRHQRRVDRRAHRHPRAARRRPTARPPRASRSRPARRRSSTPGSRPTPSTSSSSRPRRPSSPSPTPARSSATASACAAARSTSTPGAPGFVYELVVGVVDARPPATSTTCWSSAPRRSRASSTRTTAARASSSATAPPPWCSARRPTTGPVCSRGTSGATARPPACSRSPPAAAACPRRAETVADGEHYLQDGRARRSSAARCGSSSSRRPTALERAGVDRRRRRLVRPAPGQRPYHRGRRATGSGIPAERTIVNIDRYGNTVAASIPLVARRGRRRRPAAADGDLVLLSGFGAGLTWGSALLRWGRA